MLRLALTPRWLALGVLLILAVVGSVLLGRWQWDRTQDILAAEQAAASQPIDVRSARGSADDLPPESIGRPVFATGTYDPARQVVVTNRSLDGRAGAWVVTGLRVDDGAIVPVLRGWIAGPDDPAAEVPTETVAVTGVLQPDEIFYADAPVEGNAVAAISRSSLEQAWGQDPGPGYVTLISQDPMPSPAPLPVPATVQTADVPFPLQNFFYAFQWWIFAAFGVVLYVRWLRIEAKRQATVD